MKKVHSEIRMDELCDLFGLSRQSYYQQQSKGIDKALEEEIILEIVRSFRKKQRKVGIRKLLIHMAPLLQRQRIRIGRDSFFELMRKHRLLVRRRKRKAVTTDSRHSMRKYPNLTAGFIPLKANELWVSDITYIDTVEGFIYLFLITDVYSHKIVGYHASESLEASGALTALRMAIAQLKEGECPIHHSDRGTQYCSKLYVAMLEDQNLSISMTENGSPYENALAERVNGILKDELIAEHIETKKEGIQITKDSIVIYNEVRLHSSVDYLTPNVAHTKSGELKKHWKKKKVDLSTTLDSTNQESISQTTVKQSQD